MQELASVLRQRGAGRRARPGGLARLSLPSLLGTQTPSSSWVTSPPPSRFAPELSWAIWLSPRLPPLLPAMRSIGTSKEEGGGGGCNNGEEEVPSTAAFRCSRLMASWNSCADIESMWWLWRPS